MQLRSWLVEEPGQRFQARSAVGDGTVGFGGLAQDTPSLTASLGIDVEFSMANARGSSERTWCPCSIAKELLALCCRS